MLEACFVTIFVFILHILFVRQVGLNVSQIAALLEDPSIPERRDVVFYPPEDVKQSDEDSEGEEDVAGGMSVNHLGPGLLRQQAEIQFDDPTDELPDVQQVQCFIKFFSIILKKFFKIL